MKSIPLFDLDKVLNKLLRTKLSQTRGAGESLGWSEAEPQERKRERTQPAKAGIEESMVKALLIRLPPDSF
jgi:phosphoglycolate phosphatase-like HAD superfamily hydrolase